MDDALPVVRLEGSPYERGYRYGTVAYDRIRVAISGYGHAFEKAGLTPELRKRLVSAFIPPIQTSHPQLWEEMEGLADGAGVDIENVAALNLRNELLRTAQAECTSVAVLPEASASGHTLVAQNLDWKTFATPSAVVLEIIQDDDTKPNVVTVTEAGTLGRSGLNAAGVGLCVNFLSSPKAPIGSGTASLVPTQLLRRSVLDAPDFDFAERFLRQARVAIASNYLLADSAGRAIDLELAPQGLGALEPVGGLLPHANHFVTAWGSAIDTGIEVVSGTRWRLSRIEELLRRQAGAITVEVLQGALRDHANAPECVCRHADSTLEQHLQVETSISVVMDLDDRRLWWTAGPPCSSSYTTDDFPSLRPAQAEKIGPLS